jgi:hypothetical protein
MWIKSYTKTYKDIKKEEVWYMWADINNWPTWDKELEYCKMVEPFVEGSHFILKPKGGQKVKVTLSELVPKQKFTSYSNFLGATMYVAHELEETLDGLRITNTVTVTGFLSFIWIALVAKNVANSIPSHMDILIDLVRKNRG